MLKQNSLASTVFQSILFWHPSRSVFLGLQNYKHHHMILNSVCFLLHPLTPHYISSLHPCVCGGVVCKEYSIMIIIF